MSGDLEPQGRTIDTADFSAAMRRRIIDVDGRAVLLARLSDAQMASDHFHRTINCDGFGRTREYERYSIVFSNWAGQQPWKPLLRGHPYVKKLRTQVFQIAACNWRCWYCFVDDSRLAGDARFGKFFTADEIVEMFLRVRPAVDVLDISGGEPSLVPELILWLMEALDARGLRDRVWLWCDENFSNLYMWDQLSADQIRYIASFPKHSRIGCFKGFDRRSFSHSTKASESDFFKQFEVCRALLTEGIDLYAYATFTGPTPADLAHAVSQFVDSLQDVHPLFPLRVIPLRVSEFAATRHRLPSSASAIALASQDQVFAAWSLELRRRFSSKQLALDYHDVELR